MQSNRSIPSPGVIPVLSYPDVNEAAVWLCAAFGFTVRLRVGDSHRVQLNVQESGAVIVRERHADEIGATLGVGCSVMIRVEDADAHCKRAKEHGAWVTREPTTHIFGERQYSCRDLAGYSWTFSQSVADVSPEEWGGIVEHL